VFNREIVVQLISLIVHEGEKIFEFNFEF